jgi:two-component system, chemotaxis family, chemotaxis protein CheY
MDKSFFRPDLKVLIVDDFPTMRRIVRTLMKQLGFQDFYEAESGNSALAKLREQGDFELVICDWSMPEMSGRELLQEMQQDANLRHIPVLIVSAEAEKSQMVEAIKNGAYAYVIKPFTAQTLKDKLLKIESGVMKAG